MASNLEDANACLGINEEDVARVRKNTFRRKLLVRSLGLLAPLLSFIAGYGVAGGFVRSDETASWNSYPYVAVASSALYYKSFSAKTRFTIFGTIIVSVIAHIVGLVLGGSSPERDPVVVMYGVYDAGGAAYAR